MKLNERDIAVQVQARLKLPASTVPHLMTLIPAALNNLAKNIALDPTRKYILQSPRATTTATAATSTNGRYVTASLSALALSPGILIDFLRMGTMWVSYSFAFTSTDVSTLNDTITIAGASTVLTTGTPVYLSTTGTLPTGTAANTQYFTFGTAPAYSLATTYAGALAGTAVNFSGAGAGSSTMLTVPQVLQWLNSPDQGALNSGLSVQYPACYLVGTTLYLNNVIAGATVSLSVPYVPSLTDLPEDANLMQDLLDSVVELYISGDPANAQTTNAK